MTTGEDGFMKFSILRLFFSLGLVLSSIPVFAASILVNTTEDLPDDNKDGICETIKKSCSIRAAIQDSSDGAVIFIPAGAYEFSEELPPIEIENSITLKGAGFHRNRRGRVEAGTKLFAPPSYRFLDIKAPNVNIESLAIVGNSLVMNGDEFGRLGRRGRIRIYPESGLSFSEVVISGFKNLPILGNEGRLQVRRSTFEWNQSKLGILVILSVNTSFDETYFFKNEGIIFDNQFGGADKDDLTQPNWPLIAPFQFLRDRKFWPLSMNISNSTFFENPVTAIARCCGGATSFINTVFYKNGIPVKPGERKKPLVFSDSGLYYRAVHSTFIDNHGTFGTGSFSAAMTNSISYERSQDDDLLDENDAGGNIFLRTTTTVKERSTPSESSILAFDAGDSFSLIDDRKPSYRMLKFVPTRNLLTDHVGLTKVCLHHNKDQEGKLRDAEKCTPGAFQIH